MRGQRLALATTMALSIDRESLGRPASSHSRTFTGSPNMEFRGKLRCERCLTGYIVQRNRLLPFACKQMQIDAACTYAER